MEAQSPSLAQSSTPSVTPSVVSASPPSLSIDSDKSVHAAPKPAASKPTKPMKPAASKPTKPMKPAKPAVSKAIAKSAGSKPVTKLASKTSTAKTEIVKKVLKNTSGSFNFGSIGFKKSNTLQRPHCDWSAIRAGYESSLQVGSDRHFANIPSQRASIDKESQIKLEKLFENPLHPKFTSAPMNGTVLSSKERGYPNMDQEFTVMPYAFEVVTGRQSPFPTVHPLVPLVRRDLNTGKITLFFVACGPAPSAQGPTWKPKLAIESLYPYETRAFHLSPVDACTLLQMLCVLTPESPANLHQKATGIMWTLPFLLPDSILNNNVQCNNDVASIIKNASSSLSVTLLFVQPPPPMIRRILIDLADRTEGYDLWKTTGENDMTVDSDWPNVSFERFPSRSKTRRAFYESLEDYTDLAGGAQRTNYEKVAGFILSKIDTVQLQDCEKRDTLRSESVTNSLPNAVTVTDDRVNEEEELPSTEGSDSGSDSGSDEEEEEEEEEDDDDDSVDSDEDAEHDADSYSPPKPPAPKPPAPKPAAPKPAAPKPAAPKPAAPKPAAPKPTAPKPAAPKPAAPKPAAPNAPTPKPVTPTPASTPGSCSVAMTPSGSVLAPSTLEDANGASSAPKSKKDTDKSRRPAESQRNEKFLRCKPIMESVERLEEDGHLPLSSVNNGRLADALSVAKQAFQAYVKNGTVESNQDLIVALCCGVIKEQHDVIVKLSSNSLSSQGKIKESIKGREMGLSVAKAIKTILPKIDKATKMHAESSALLSDIFTNLYDTAISVSCATIPQGCAIRSNPSTSSTSSTPNLS